MNCSILRSPADTQGSWVNLCTDNKGRLLVSDQFGGLYRITPPAPGKTLSAADVAAGARQHSSRERNGLGVWCFVRRSQRLRTKIPSGLYRITDSDGDDQLDKVELLRAMEARGDHGVHAVVPSPDGKSLFLITGNTTKPTEFAETSQVPQVWGEDHLLPSFPDGRGHNRGVLAPGGIIYRVDPDGKNFEAYANGFRNIFDAAFNRDGELFTYDADMEYDFNTPWYRATRICMVTSGAEFGWRNGAGKRPPFYADNLPGILDIGPGSPTGMTFGYGAKFPAKYQNALYALDWSWGKLYAVHLKPNGSCHTQLPKKNSSRELRCRSPTPSSIRATEQCTSRSAADEVQSGLYRVTYVGDESTELGQTRNPAKSKALVTFVMHWNNSMARRTAGMPSSLRGRTCRTVIVSFASPLERLLNISPSKTWADKALKESDPEETGRSVAGSRASGRRLPAAPWRFHAPPVDTQMRDKLLPPFSQSICQSWTRPASSHCSAHSRSSSIDSGGPNDATVQKLIAAFDPLFPSESAELNWLLVRDARMAAVANRRGESDGADRGRSDPGRAGAVRPLDPSC